MASREDVEEGRYPRENITTPLINHHEITPSIGILDGEGRSHINGDKETNRGSIGMVILSTVVAVCGSFEFGMCMGYTAPTQSGLVADLDLSIAEFSFFGSILNFAAMIGSIMGGQISESIGRKKAMRLSAVICILGWLLIYFSEGTVVLDIGRFLTGYGIAVFSYVVPMYIAEITPKDLRGGFATMNQLFICSGGSYAYIVGTFVTWRTLALSGTFPCILLFIGLFFIPESPRWMAKRGDQDKEFEEALRLLRGKNTDISCEAKEIREYIETMEKLPKATLQDLVGRKYRRFLIIGVGLILFQQFGGINGVGFYASTILQSAGLPSGDFGLIVMASIQVPVTVLGAFLMDKSGRRQLLLISSFGVLTACLVTAFSYYWKDHGFLLDWDPILTLTGIVLFVGFFSLGMGAIPWVIMSEIFPVNIKGIGGSMVTLGHWVGAWVLSYFFNFLAAWSSSGTFFIFALVNIFSIVFTTVMVPETKGRTLEEIQASMNAS